MTEVFCVWIGGLKGKQGGAYMAHEREINHKKGGWHCHSEHNMSLYLILP